MTPGEEKAKRSSIEKIKQLNCLIIPENARPANQISPGKSPMGHQMGVEHKEQWPAKSRHSISPTF